MPWLDDWVDRALSCFHREKDEPSPPDPEPPRFLTDEVLNEQFNGFLLELDLSEAKQKEMLGQSRENKIAMLNNHNIGTSDPKRLIELLEQWNTKFPEEETDEQFQNVVTTLRTEHHRHETRLELEVASRFSVYGHPIRCPKCDKFVEEFIKRSGLQLLSNLLFLCGEKPCRARASVFFLYSIRALLNCNFGRRSVIESPRVLLAIASSINCVDARVKIASIEILSGLCFIPEGGHREVLAAFTHVSSLLGERTRFQKLLDDLYRKVDSERDTDRLRKAVMSLVNSILRTGQAENSTEFRLHLRYEMLMLGIQEIVDKIKVDASPALSDHIELFEMMRKEDEMSLQGCHSDDSGASSPVDFESASCMAEALSRRLSHSVALPHFISLLQHLLMIPFDERHVPLWRLFDLLLQHISLQSSFQGISDVNVPIVPIDIEDVLCRLHTQCEYEKIERELEKVKEELKGIREKNVFLERVLSESKGKDPPKEPDIPAHPPPPPAAPLPPVVPPSFPPPPPPPPSTSQPPPQEFKKKVPQPPNATKSVNWKVIPREKIKGTVWENMDEEKLYKQIDLNELAHNFSSVGNQKEDENDMGTISRRNKDTKISILDSRRAQNCTIMLSKLKMQNKEIRRSLMEMNELIPKDVIEQMLKFLPSKQEKEQLAEVLSRFKTPSVLAVADRFLWEISQVPHYEQRLKCLHIIRTFKDRIELLEPSMESVAQASSSLLSSRRFPQLLGLVLAVGNYLNYGKRNGNASGFSLPSLSCLSDVRSTLRADRTLLHHVAFLVEHTFPDISKFRLELRYICEAARFSKAEVVSEMKNLERSIDEVELEIGEMRKEQAMDGDLFVDIASEFVQSARKDYSRLDNTYTHMNNKYGECIRRFASDSFCPPDVFFSSINKFLTAFSDCQQHIWMENEQKNQVKRQTLARTLFAKKNRKRGEKERNFEQLISALQSGEIFSDELSRLRSSFRDTKKNFR